MDFKEILIISFSSLKTNKTRSFLTMLGIIIGVSSVILLLAIGNGLKNYITNQLQSIGAESLFIVPGNMEIKMGGGGGGGMPGAGTALPKFTSQHYQKLKTEVKSARYIMPYIEANASLRYEGKTHTTQLSGVSHQYPQVRNHQIAQGNFFNFSQENSAKKVVVLGKKVADELFEEENPIGKKISIGDQRYTVLGVLEEKGAFGSINLDDQAFAPWTTVMKQYDLEKIQSFWIVSQEVKTVPQTKQEVQDCLLKFLKEEDFSILDTKSILNVVSSILNILTAALAGIAAISLIVGGIGIMNIMLVSVTERTKEIGLRKAVGATSKNILYQFLTEAVIFSLFGGAIGIIVGVLGALFLNRFLKTTITYQSIILSFGVSTLVGIIFGVTPAAKAAKLDPINALRYE